MKRSSWIALFLLALMASLYVFLKNRPIQEEEASAGPTSTPRVYLYDYSEERGPIVAIRIQDSEGNFIELEKKNEQWFIKAPTASLADQSKVTMAETQIYGLGVKTLLEGTLDLPTIGLDKPKYVIEIRFQNGQASRLEVGSRAPSGSGYYVRRDGELFVAHEYNIDALASLIQYPPYPPTPTPEGTLTPTAPITPTLTATPTPETPTSTPE